MLAQGFLFRRQEPDTRGHPTRQRDGPTLPRKDQVAASFDSINPSSLRKMSGNSLLPLVEDAEPDTREHPNRQGDGPTLPRKDRVEASFDSIDPSSLKEMSGNFRLKLFLERLDYRQQLF